MDQDNQAPDYRKTLPILREEWEDCEKCNLGVERKQADGAFVFGEGTPGGIMFIGESPGAVEEQEGHPFVGPAGQVLRNTIQQLGITNYWITNLVTCRSCVQAISSEGQPIFRTDRKTKERYPLIVDQVPNPMQTASCMPRLLEEIYLVDPVLIVALGAEAAKALIRGNTAPTRGATTPIYVPGAWRVAALTLKKRKWLRKVKGDWVRPTNQNMVGYSMLPTWHPAYLLRNHSDKRPGNPVDEYMAHMKKAVAIYDEYMNEVHGVMPQERELSRDATIPEEH